MLFIFAGDLLFTKLLMNILFLFWSRMVTLLHWNCMYFMIEMNNIFLMNLYVYMVMYYTLVLWFMMYNAGSLILFYELSFLSVFVLAMLLVSVFFGYLIHFTSGFYYYVFAHLLCGDEFMDVLIIRFLLCMLECFSLLCSCAALFLRLFCNLLASHFLLTLFLDFMYFFLCFNWFINVWLFQGFFIMIMNMCAILMIGIFYAFLITLDLFSSMLQLYMLMSMLHLGVSDWAITKHV